MGLGTSVGMLCDQARNDPEGFEIHRGGFDRLTRALAQEEVIEWREPEILHESGEHDYSGGFPYNYLAGPSAPRVHPRAARRAGHRRLRHQ